MSKKHRNRGLIPQHPSQPQLRPTQGVLRTTYQGPLPPPEQLERYNLVVPGMAERLLNAFEHQGVHRRKMDETSLTFNFSLARGGQVCAVIIGVTSLLCGTYLVVSGSSTIGVATMFGTIGSMIGAFLYTSRQARPPKGDVQQAEQSLAKVG